MAYKYAGSRTHFVGHRSIADRGIRRAGNQNQKCPRQINAWEDSGHAMPILVHELESNTGGFFFFPSQYDCGWSTRRLIQQFLL